MTRLFSHAQAARYYDLLGAGLDTQAFYETAALHDLVAHLQLARCQSVVEFGIGTGRLAEELLRAHIPADAICVGLDVSATMVRLAKSRLRPFAVRAEVRQSDRTPRIDAQDDTFDRFISTYVFDLLSDDDIRAVLREARRVLTPDGLMAATGDGVENREKSLAQKNLKGGVCGFNTEPSDHRNRGRRVSNRSEAPTA